MPTKPPRRMLTQAPRQARKGRRGQRHTKGPGPCVRRHPPPFQVRGGRKQRRLRPPPPHTAQAPAPQPALQAPAQCLGGGGGGCALICKRRKHRLHPLPINARLVLGQGLKHGEVQQQGAVKSRGEGAAAAAAAGGSSRGGSRGAGKLLPRTPPPRRANVRICGLLRHWEQLASTG